MQPFFVGEHQRLKTAGKYGFFTVMLLLYWWGCADGRSDAWMASVSHAISALDGMLGLQRPSPPPPEYQPKPV
jgi:hypothetical protein